MVPEIYTLRVEHGISFIYLFSFPPWSHRKLPETRKTHANIELIKGRYIALERYFYVTLFNYHVPDC
jgi:hypothetical protein